MISIRKVFTEIFGPFQIDNQLFGTPRPILLYVTPTSKDEITAEAKPALHICAHKMSSRHWNAQIFKVTNTSWNKVW